MHTVLVIDDEPEVSKLVAIGLKHYGPFAVISAFDAATGLREARQDSVEAIILDLMLPGMTGFDVCEVLHASLSTKRIPIIILSAKVEEADRVLGFELGAIDYVTKPFSPRELGLRISMLFRDNRRDIELARLTSDALVVDPNRHQVSVRGKTIALTAVEFKLLAYLMEKRGRTQPRDQLLRNVWEYKGDLVTRTVDMHMLRLRRKLGPAASAIETVHGFGYRFRDPFSIDIES